MSTVEENNDLIYDGDRIKYGWFNSGAIENFDDPRLFPNEAHGIYTHIITYQKSDKRYEESSQCNCSCYMCIDGEK